MKLSLLVSLLIWTNLFSLNAEEQSKWIPSSKSIGDYGTLTFCNVAKIHRTPLNEYMATVKVLNCEEGRKLLVVLETGSKWGYRTLLKVKNNKSRVTIRAICVGTYKSKKKKKRFLLFEMIKPNEKEVSNAYTKE